MTRKLILLFALAAVAAAGRQERYLELGSKRLERFDKAKSNATRLKQLRAARYYFAKAGKAGQADLVRTLNRESGICYARKSLSLAEKRNASALKLAPGDPTALRLQAAIRQSKKSDIYENVDGLIGINRVRARRLRSGVPLRDRGRARRR